MEKRKPLKRELVPDKYMSDGLLYILWKLTRVDYSNPRQLFEFGFEYIKPYYWDNKDMAYKLFALSEQFGITLQNPRFEESYFKDSHPDDYKEIVKLTEEELKKEPEVFDKLFDTKNRILARKKVLEGKNLTMKDAKELALDIIPMNITHLYDGIWFEVRPDSNAKKKLSKFLDIYLTNFINDKLIGQPQTLDYSLIKPQNFYTFEKHRFWGDFKLREMREKYGDRFTLTGLVAKDEEFLHIHYLLALNKLGLIKIGRLGTNSGAYTHGDDPEWEAYLTIQAGFNNSNAPKKEVAKERACLDTDKKREWFGFFKKMGVIKDGSKQAEELKKEFGRYASLGSDSFDGKIMRGLLKETDFTFTEEPAKMKKMDWIFREYNSTPYSLEKSESTIINSLNKLSEKYETIPLVYTTLPLPTYMNYSSEVWREIFSIHSFEKEDFGHIDFLNALASLVNDGVISILSFDTIYINDKTLVFKATIIGYKPTPTLDKQPEAKSKKDGKLQRSPLPITGEIKITGLQEGLQAIAGIKKDDKNKFPHKLPAGTKWENFTIKFENDENVFIQVKQFKHYANYKEMGFTGRGANPGPSEAWVFLKVLAQVQGELTLKDTEARDKYKKQKELLAKSLQDYFSLDYDPFYPYRSSSEKSGDSYKIKITLIPDSPNPDIKTGIGKNKNNDKFGTKTYFAEQTPEVYSEDE